MITVGCHFVGCRLNEAENEQIARDLVDEGFCMVRPEDDPDVLILNTCGVTSEAMHKSRKYARRMAGKMPKILVLMGCAVDLMQSGENPLSDEELSAEASSPMKIVRIFRADRPRASQIITSAIRAFIPSETATAETLAQAAASYRKRMRSFIKIEDGCSNQCTYCSVRLARGPERSIPSEQIIKEIQRCIDIGEKEFVLTGVQVGAWKEDNRRLPDLIRDILDKTPIQRLRLSSIEPWHTRPELWTLWHDSRLCPHFHIPVQSGSDAVLTAMKRRTPIAGYLEKLDKIRAEIPHVRISTDLIVGFPGETAEMWEETLSFIRTAQFDSVHLFTFSARPGTIAAELPNPVSAEEKRRRWYEAQTLIDAIRRTRLQKTIGQPCEVLWENVCEDLPGQKRWYGYSQNYLHITRLFDENRWMRGEITHEIFEEIDIDKNLHKDI